MQIIILYSHSWIVIDMSVLALELLLLWRLAPALHVSNISSHNAEIIYTYMLDNTNSAWQAQM